MRRSVGEVRRAWTRAGLLLLAGGALFGMLYAAGPAQTSDEGEAAPEALVQLLDEGQAVVLGVQQEETGFLGKNLVSVPSTPRR